MNESFCLTSYMNCCLVAITLKLQFLLLVGNFPYQKIHSTIHATPAHLFVSNLSSNYPTFSNKTLFLQQEGHQMEISIDPLKVLIDSFIHIFNIGERTKLFRNVPFSSWHLSWVIALSLTLHLQTTYNVCKSHVVLTQGKYVTSYEWHLISER